MTNGTVGGTGHAGGSGGGGGAVEAAVGLKMKFKRKNASSKSSEMKAEIVPTSGDGPKKHSHKHKHQDKNCTYKKDKRDKEKHSKNSTDRSAPDCHGPKTPVSPMTSSSANSHTATNNNHLPSPLKLDEPSTKSCKIEKIESEPECYGSGISARKDTATSTSQGTTTEPEFFGPCEPGTSVTLDGVVWHETEGGVLVVNVTWREKSYVGTLLDCTKHDWAPPRLCDSPADDDVKGKGRNAKKGRVPVSERVAAQSKLRNGKGRQTNNSGFVVPESPKSDLKRKAGSPALIECPEPNCNKKYRHINGLKYHQTHAHFDKNSSGSKNGEGDETDKVAEDGEAEDLPSSSTSPKSVDNEVAEIAAIAAKFDAADGVIAPIAVAAATTNSIDAINDSYKDGVKEDQRLGPGDGLSSALLSAGSNKDVEMLGPYSDISDDNESDDDSVKERADEKDSLITATAAASAATAADQQQPYPALPYKKSFLIENSTVAATATVLATKQPPLPVDLAGEKMDNSSGSSTHHNSAFSYSAYHHTSYPALFNIGNSASTTNNSSSSSTSPSPAVPNSGTLPPPSSLKELNSFFINQCKHPCN